MQRATTFRRVFLVVVVLAVAFAAGPSRAASPTPEHQRPGGDRTPVVFFPGMGGSLVQVVVENQTSFPECPSSGTFVVGAPAPEFSTVCQDLMLTLVYDADHNKPMPRRFSSPRGIKVVLPASGRTANAPWYEPLYTALEAAGYQRDRNIRVASYDFRLTPDMGGFLERTLELIEETYRENGNRPVHLVGHSNGPIYAQYVLTHTSQAWKQKYIHGFSSFSGNFPGQGWAYTLLFTGLDPWAGYPTDAEGARISANMWASWPATYVTASSPEYFGAQEVVVRDLSTGVSYTPADYRQLFADAGLGGLLDIADYYLGFDKFATPDSFPNVDVYAEKGSGFDTVVGIVLPTLQVGQVLDADTEWITLPGDGNQEDLTNDSVVAWQVMACHHFELNDNPGVSHNELSFSGPVIDRLLIHLAQSPSACRYDHGARGDWDGKRWGVQDLLQPASIQRRDRFVRLR